MTLTNCTYQQLLNHGGSIGLRSVDALRKEIQDLLTPQISNLLDKLIVNELSQIPDTVHDDRVSPQTDKK